MCIAVMMKPPTLPPSHPDRQLELTQAIESDDFVVREGGTEAIGDDAFKALAMRAEAAGWTPNEIAAAMVALGEKYASIKTNRIPGSGEDNGDHTDA